MDDARSAAERDRTKRPRLEEEAIPLDLFQAGAAHAAGQYSSEQVWKAAVGSPEFRQGTTTVLLKACEVLQYLRPGPDANMQQLEACADRMVAQASKFPGGPQNEEERAKEESLLSKELLQAERSRITSMEAEAAAATGALSIYRTLLDQAEAEMLKLKGEKARMEEASASEKVRFEAEKAEMEEALAEKVRLEATARHQLKVAAAALRFEARKAKNIEAVARLQVEANTAKTEAVARELEQVKAELIAGMEAATCELEARKAKIEEDAAREWEQERANLTAAMEAAICELEARIADIQEAAREDVEACQICYSEPRNVLLLPCTHARYCRRCIDKVLELSQPCPSCRRSIAGVLSFIE